MHVQELWRYPVKSMRGERLLRAHVAEGGVEGDRLVHARQAGGRVVTSRFWPQLLGFAGTLGADGEPLVDGERWYAPSVLERVRAATSPDVELVRFHGVDVGQRHDVLPLTVLTDGMARAVGVDHRRFRPNLLIGGVEELEETAWPGRGLRIGGLVIGIRNRRSRCVMTTFDPDTIEQDPSVLLRVVRQFGGQVALDCWVVSPGTVSVGDAVEIVELNPKSPATLERARIPTNRGET
ncbi:MAG TPA: MOSC N-terminal beta barrel domain-containing protein [Gaiellaceae bacterium]|nr:MOSC N-terminal beta barrel domain-containing protein [Gaiellaceae bacterium]